MIPRGIWLGFLLAFSSLLIADEVNDMYKAVVQSCRKNRDVQARSRYDAMRRKYPDSALTRQAELVLIESGRDYFDMVVGLKLFLKQNPSWPETDRILYRLAGLYLLHNNYSEALVTYRTILSNHSQSPLAPQARLQSGNILLSRTDFDGAEQSFLQASASEPIRDLAFLRLADILFYRKQYVDSASNYSRLIRSSPADPEIRSEALFFLGESWTALGKKYEAAGSYRTILLEFPDSEYARLSRERLAALGFPEKSDRPGSKKKQASGTVSRRYAQAGAFRDIRTANALRLKMKKDGFDVALKRQAERDGYLYRVLAGPFRDQPETLKAVSKLREKYGCDAFSVIERE